MYRQVKARLQFSLAKGIVLVNSFKFSLQERNSFHSLGSSLIDIKGSASSSEPWPFRERSFPTHRSFRFLVAKIEKPLEHAYCVSQPLRSKSKNGMSDTRLPSPRSRVLASVACRSRSLATLALRHGLSCFHFFFSLFFFLFFFFLNRFQRKLWFS